MSRNRERKRAARHQANDMNVDESTKLQTFVMDDDNDDEVVEELSPPKFQSIARAGKFLEMWHFEKINLVPNAMFFIACGLRTIW